MKGQWWIPVIAIVLGTGLAIAIDRLPGGGGTNDVQLDLSQQSPSTLPLEEETTTTLLEETTTTAFLDPAAFATAPSGGSSSGTSRTATTRRTTTATTRRASTGTTATTPATAPPATSPPATGPMSGPPPGSPEWCEMPEYKDYCSPDDDEGPGPTRPPRTSTTDSDF